MPDQPTQTDSIDIDTASNPETIDTDVGSFIDEIQAGAAGDPTIVDVGLADYTIERVDLEREPGETLQDWIRSAIDMMLTDTDADDGATDGLEGWPSGDEDSHDTPSDVITARAADADRGEYIRVGVDLPGVVVATLYDMGQTDRSVGDWIRDAVRRRFSEIDQDLELRPTVEVEVPWGLAARARLRAQHRANTKGGDYEDALVDSINELVQPQPEFVLENGEVLATLADEASRDDGHTASDVEATAAGAAADDLGLDLDLESSATPLADLKAALAERHEPAWSLETVVHVDAETAERFRPAFEQALADPDEDLSELIENYGATDVTLTIDGYDPRYYFESEEARDRQMKSAIINALEAADEPLDWGELEAATGIGSDALDAKLEALQADFNVQYSARGGGWVLVDDSQA